MHASCYVPSFTYWEIKVCDNNNTSYIYTIDVSYNDELKQKTKTYPFFPEKTKANVDQFQTIKMKNRENYIPNKNMMLKFTDKADYVTDGEMSNWYLNLGLKLEDITIKQKLEYIKMNG